MLPAETIRKIVGLARASGVRTIPVPGAQDGEYIVVDEDGSYTYSRPDRIVTPEHLDIPSICRMAIDRYKEWNSNGDISATLPRPILYYSFDSVVLSSLQASDRFQARFGIEPSEPLNLLTEWKDDGRGLLKQSDLILKLRTTLAGCWSGNLLDIVRKIDVKKGLDAQTQINQGKVSMSRAHVAEMTGLEKLPEQVTFNVPIFATGSLQHLRGNVTVAIDPDPQTETFSLYVLPGQIEAVIAEAESNIRGMIDSAIEGYEIPVYYGRP